MDLFLKGFQRHGKQTESHKRSVSLYRSFAKKWRAKNQFNSLLLNKFS